MNRHQRHLLEMLGEIDAICAAHGITYFVGMGTLIGAVRHKGFLPWDDDADIFMPYEDWERFKQVCGQPGVLPANRYLGSPDTQAAHCHLIPRYVSRDTTTIHTCQSLHDDVAGEVIDIFVLDPIADGARAYEAYAHDLYLYSSLVNYANVAGTRFEIDPGRFERYLALEREKGRLHVTRLLEAKLASHFDKAGSRYAMRWQSVLVCFERAWFSEAVRLPFEGMMLPAPAGAAEVLASYYGDNWPEIPAHVTPARHNVAFSLDFAYTEALEFYRPPYPRSRLRAEADERRVLHLRQAKEANALKDRAAALKAHVAAVNLADTLQRNRAAFDDALAAGDGVALAAILEDYIAEQTSRELVGRYTDGGFYRYMHPVLVEAPDEAFEAALDALVATGRLPKVRRLLEVRERCGGALTPAMRRAAEAVRLYHAACVERWHGRCEAGLEKAERLLELYPDANAFWKLRCTLLAGVGGRGGELERCVREGAERFDADGLYLKLLADVEAGRGEHERARAMYLQAAEGTRDGFALLDIAERTGYHPSWLREPSWAKEAGVPQWDGPTPEPPAPAPAPAPAACDSREEYLFGLLCELAGRCEELGVGYILAPAAASALLGHDALPDAVEGYALLVDAGELPRLVAALGDVPREGRRVEYMGNSAAVHDRSLRYHGDDSLLLSLQADALGPFDTLYASVYPLEPKAYPAGLERVLAQWGRAAAGRFAPQGRRARLYAALHRVGAGAVGGARLFELACAKAAGGSYLRQRKTARKVDRAFLRDTRLSSVRGHDLRVPADLEGYLAAHPAPAPAPFLRPTAKRVSSTRLTPQELADGPVLGDGYFERKRRFEKEAARGREIYARFSENFEAIKAAVREKERSLA